MPTLGALRMGEITVARVDRTVSQARTRSGIASAKIVRTILSGVLGLAVRCDALSENPVRDVGRIESAEREARSLDLARARDLRARIATDRTARVRDLPDSTDMMLATGMRIGETAAVTWGAVDLDAATVQIRGTVIRLKGQGLTLK